MAFKLTLIGIVVAAVLFGMFLLIIPSSPTFQESCVDIGGRVDTQDSDVCIKEVD